MSHIVLLLASESLLILIAFVIDTNVSNILRGHKINIRQKHDVHRHSIHLDFLRLIADV
jgi:hypothetical protein